MVRLLNGTAFIISECNNGRASGWLDYASTGDLGYYAPSLMNSGNYVSYIPFPSLKPA